MIECKNCRLPALPPVLFWEGLLSTRIPCLCGCLERVGSYSRISASSPMLCEDKHALDRATNEGMAVPEVAAARHQPVARPCDKTWAKERSAMQAEIRAVIQAERQAEIRASDDGMPEQIFNKEMVAAAAPMRAWKDFVVEEMRQSHDFSQWLMTRDKKMPTPANKEGVLVNGVFRSAPLRNSFHFQAQRTVPKEKNTAAEDYNPYMSGMEILAQIFKADYG